jgi:hypothetical protein
MFIINSNASSNGMRMRATFIWFINVAFYVPELTQWYRLYFDQSHFIPNAFIQPAAYSLY